MRYSAVKANDVQTSHCAIADIQKVTLLLQEIGTTTRTGSFIDFVESVWC